jgi:hypothetical protein
MEGDVELIREILPNVDEAQIRKVLEETGELGLAVKQLLFPGSPVIRRNARISKRTVVSVHTGCSEVAIEAAQAAIACVRSAELTVSEFAPQSTISISFQSTPCKPMIYINPEPLDAQLCENIEPMSIIVTDRFDDVDVRAFCSFNGVLVLPFTRETVLRSVQQVLAESGIIASGFPQRKTGELWHEMLCRIPLIQGTYAHAIATDVPSPYAVLHHFPTEVLSKAGNRIPAKVLDRLRSFFETDNPDQRLETRNPKRRQPSPSGNDRL